MRIRWGRVILTAIAAGVLVLLLRSCVAARRLNLGAAVERTESPAIAVFDHRAGALLSLPLETYLVGVVAAEMPASFPLEALKAQAVAARTYTAYHALHGGCKQHAADVCTSSGCCQAYATEARMRENWGSSYRANLLKVRAAVSETAGEVLLYGGEPIEALYHSASGGRTENVEDVYAVALPYLRSVMSTAESGTARLIGEKRYAKKEFCALVNEKWPGAKLSAARLEQSVEILETTESGRVQSLRLGGETVTGRQLRSLLSLDSALFTVDFPAGEIRFSTKGFGHGVGMSQTGANAMALGGRAYDEILLYYYTGVTLGRVSAD